ncbi:DUF982 domain-containing protein [Mesorhizobium sp. J428]|uniref:DUF982 domain-containing protein n=1 Tax=Mesorhizobium sp. J428 TaxID=2898440 RepID=UPI002151A4D7|nr:DUF982 domain-containing protein [Mesorhizobium sp. J428]MCR5857169.1 DUF982 domain-containing protein [Mesorhizobium sp. J428]
MNGAAFERPLTMFVGLGFPRHIDNATDALQALDELAPLEHGPAHDVAVRACRAALLGEIEPETARGIVEAYARARGVLIDDLPAHHAMAASNDRVGA